jgi:hypothetical protein
MQDFPMGILHSSVFVWSIGDEEKKSFETLQNFIFLPDVPDKYASIL